MEILQEVHSNSEKYNVQRMINLVHIYWNKPDNVKWIREKSLDEKKVYAFSLIKQEKKDLAVKILEEEQTQLVDDFQHGYYYYYLGLAKDDEKYFYESIKYFSKSGDHFFRQLPLLALKDKGVDTMLISALSV